jgi:hypothetical protein
MTARKHKPHGIGNFKPCYTDRFWHLDVDAYARMCRFEQLTLSDVTLNWAKERKTTIREKYPTHSKVFDRIDKEYEK